MRVLVTGVSGFVGARLAAALVARGDRVCGTYISDRPGLPGVELFEADLLDQPALAAAVTAARPEAVVHLGALSHVGESWKRMHQYFRVNVMGTENVLDAIGGARLLYASSAEVYGLVPENEQPIPERRPLAPQSPYALTKAAAERLAVRRGAVVVRSFNLAGPGQAAGFALPSFAGQLARIAAGEQAPVLDVGNLSARRDFLHIDDGVAGYLALLDGGAPGEVYNLGSGTARTIGDLLDLLIEVSGLEVSVRSDPERWRPVDLPLLMADVGRLRGLGWAPARDLRTALDDLWRSVGG